MGRRSVLLVTVSCCCVAAVAAVAAAAAAVAAVAAVLAAVGAVAVEIVALDVVLLKTSGCELALLAWVISPAFVETLLLQILRMKSHRRHRYQ